MRFNEWRAHLCATLDVTGASCSGFGYEGEAAGQFVEAVKTISEMTTVLGPGFLRRGMGAGAGGRGGQ